MQKNELVPKNLRDREVNLPKINTAQTRIQEDNYSHQRRKCQFLMLLDYSLAADPKVEQAGPWCPHSLEADAQKKHGGRDLQKQSMPALPDRQRLATV